MERCDLPGDLLAEILAHTAAVDKKTTLQFSCACRYTCNLLRSTDFLVRVLLSAHGDPDAALLIAAKHGHAPAVEMLCGWFNDGRRPSGQRGFHPLICGMSPAAQPGSCRI